MSDSSDYEVGYGRPPREHQFKKGSRGNPRGRPKGASSNLFEKVLGRKIAVGRDGKQEKITVAEAALTQLSHRAAKGDLRAIGELFRLARLYEVNSAPGHVKSVQKPPAPPRNIRLVVVPAHPLEAISEALIALGICDQRGKVSQIESWWVEAAIKHAGLKALDRAGIDKLRTLMAHPEDLDGIIKRARKTAKDDGADAEAA
jgi:hypothetical protein